MCPGAQEEWEEFPGMNSALFNPHLYHTQTSYLDGFVTPIHLTTFAAPCHTTHTPPPPPPPWTQELPGGRAHS